VGKPRGGDLPDGSAAGILAAVARRCCSSCARRNRSVDCRSSACSASISCCGCRSASRSRRCVKPMAGLPGGGGLAPLAGARGGERNCTRLGSSIGGAAPSALLLATPGCSGRPRSAFWVGLRGCPRGASLPNTKPLRLISKDCSSSSVGAPFEDQWALPAIWASTAMWASPAMF